MEPLEIAAGAFQLQPWAAHDAEDVFEACQDEQIQRFTTVPSPYAYADAEFFVGTVSPKGWESGSAASFAVKDATTGQLLAAVGLHGFVGRDSSAELGYWCAPWARGRGATTAGARAVCRWAFDTGLVEAIRWVAAADNAASKAVAAKLGFSFDGELRAYLGAWPPSEDVGQRRDALHGMLLRGELT